MAQTRLANKNSNPSPKSGAHNLGSNPVRWEALPHQELWKAAQDSMGSGSRTRAAEDAKLHVLKRRLSRLDPADHMNYIEIACARLVELLRAVRDAYRHYLEERGAKPLAEMYWVVVRFGVRDWAVMALRDAIFDYIGHCRIRREHWKALFEEEAPFQVSSGRADVAKPSPIIQADASLRHTISCFLGEEAFDIVVEGGYFGREYQSVLTQVTPGLAVLMGRSTVLEAIKQRQTLWDDCYPWTEGLAMLFDAAQEELFAQYDSLADDGRRAESRFLQLSAFQRIAYKHLHGMKAGETRSRNLGETRWLALLAELDHQGVLVDLELKGTVKKVLMAVRKKGVMIDTWTQCYRSPAVVTLETGKRYRLKREVNHAIHNAAKSASYQLRKVWAC